MGGMTADGSDSSRSAVMGVLTEGNTCTRNNNDVYQLVSGDNEITLGLPALMTAIQGLRKEVTREIQSTDDPGKRDELKSYDQTLRGMMDKGKHGQQIFDPANLSDTTVLAVLGATMGDFAPGTQKQSGSNAIDFYSNNFINSAFEKNLGNAPGAVHAGPHTNDINSKVSPGIANVLKGPQNTNINVTEGSGTVQGSAGLVGNHVNSSIQYTDGTVSVGINHRGSETTEQIRVDSGNTHVFASHKDTNNYAGFELHRLHDGKDTNIGAVFPQSGKPTLSVGITTDHDRTDVSIKQGEIKAKYSHSF